LTTFQLSATQFPEEPKFQERRKQFLSSHEAVNAADNEFEALRTELEQLIASVKASSSISLELKRTRRHIVILGLLQGLSINWRCHWSNTLDGAGLNVTLWGGHPPFPNFQPFEEPNKLDTLDFTFDLLQNDQHCWMSTDARPFSSKDLASFLLKYFMDKVNLERKR